MTPVNDEQEIKLYDNSTWPHSLADDPEKATTFTGVAYEFDYETQQVYRVYFQDGRFSFGHDKFDMNRSNDPLHRGYINNIFWSWRDAEIVGALNNIHTALRVLEDAKISLNLER